MNQIAIGDASAGYTVLDGQSVAAPYRRAAAFFSFSANPTVDEKIEIQLAGTPTQISTALGTLETINQRAQAYALRQYASPQFLRFQPVASGAYYYAQLQSIFLDAHPNAYITHQRGSFLVSLHYTRPNHFDGAKTELALTGRGGTDVTGGFDLFNHTDFHATHGNTALIKAAAAITELPAPIRIELENTYASNLIKDIMVGAYHHPTSIDETVFFANSADLTGGTAYLNAAAINEYYRRVTWTASVYTALYNYGIPSLEIDDLDGKTFRPILHLYASHAYTDLHMKILLKRGTYTLQTCEPVYCDPSYDYIVFPPVQLPPNQLLRELTPHHVEIQIYGLKEDGAAAQIDVDQLILLPLDYGATFNGFFEMDQDDKLIDDSFYGLSNVRYSAAGAETIAHIRHGDQILLYPSHNTRLFFIMANEVNTIDIMRTAELKVYYYPRTRVL